MPAIRFRADEDIRRAGRLRRAVRSVLQGRRRRRGTGRVANERLRDIFRRRRG